MMIWELVRDAWPLILMVVVSLWYFCRAMIPAGNDVILSLGNDAAKRARMAERAREYEQKYGTREGNYTV